MSNSLEYNLRVNSRARRISVTVRRDGSVWVTKPRRVSQHDVEQFVQKSVAWIAKAKKRFEGIPKTSRVGMSKKQYKLYKQAALDLVERRIRELNVHYRFRFAKLFIRDQKSRWGSCSKSGNLSFNYRIVFLPAHLADYIIVHELCHLREMNHSKRFWGLVEKAIPEHTAHKRELRKRERGLLLD